MTLAEAHRLAPSATEIEVRPDMGNTRVADVLLHGPVPEAEIAALQAALDLRPMLGVVWKVRAGEADR
jgi:hypothetical protein